MSRDEIAREFLYATDMFDNHAEIMANPEHRLVIAAYRAADAISAKLANQQIMKTEGR